MRHLDELCEAVDKPFSCLRMDFDQRQKVRSRVLATNGEYVGVHIQRGTSLKDGDHLRSQDGEVFVVRAKREELSVVRCNDPLKLVRVAYHLGNRHVRLQIDPERLAYQHDHVLDEMVRGLGFEVEKDYLPFEPEPGAYHSHGGRHEHAHGAGHSHSHSHSHGSDHHQHEGHADGGDTSSGHFRADASEQSAESKENEPSSVRSMRPAQELKSRS